MCRHQPIYIDFTTMLSNYKGRPIYNVTNNYFKMHVNGSASASLTLNSSTLTTNGITCGPISCTGSGTKPIQPSAASVYLGLDSSAAGGMESVAVLYHTSTSQLLASISKVGLFKPMLIVALSGR